MNSSELNSSEPRVEEPHSDIPASARPTGLGGCQVCIRISAYYEYVSSFSMPRLTRSSCDQAAQQLSDPVRDLDDLLGREVTRARHGHPQLAEDPRGLVGEDHDAVRQ